MLIPELETVLKAARLLAPDKLPVLLGELEEIRVTAWSRLTLPLVSPSVPQSREELLGVEAAALRLHVSKGYLYRHAARFHFTRRVGRALRFSSSGIDRYIQDSGALTNRRRKITVGSEVTQP